MEDKMEFPKTMREFIDNHSFKDIEESYTNGAELVPVFRVEQSLEHYEKEIYNKAIDDFVEKVELEYLGVHPDELYEKYYPSEICKQIKRLAEQLKAGGNNEQSI